AKNEEEFASQKALDYWQNVDVYFGGAEHAVGHLLYSRFWHKFLFDLGYVKTDEPFQKMVNQGMIQGVSAIAYLVYVEFSNCVDIENLNPNRIAQDVPRPLLLLISEEQYNRVQAGESVSEI